MFQKDTKKNKDTSWRKVGGWYNQLVGGKGHYYHQQVIIPNTVRLLRLGRGDSLLDLACGEGVLGRIIPRGVRYTGVDLAENLIRLAISKDNNREHRYVVADVTKKLALKNRFNRGTMVLALQNIRHPEGVFDNIAEWLEEGGRFVMVINHPCFRVPRQSSWETDRDNKIQYRKIARYMNRLEVPILTNPGKKAQSKTSWSFHYPLSDISRIAADRGLGIEVIEEWVSDKKSTGRYTKMEDRARNEIPMFMAMVFVKPRAETKKPVNQVFLAGINSTNLTD